MSARRRIAVAIATAALVLPTAVGCSAVEKAMDCIETAEAIATSVDKLTQAVSNAAENPVAARESLDAIDRELKNLGDKTDNADLTKAVDDLTAGVDNVRKAIENGDPTPDIKPVTDAAAEMGKVCGV
jgi:phage tail sheath gpL-like